MEKRRDAAAAVSEWLLLFGAIVAAYWPALHGGMLWDDDHHLTAPELQSLPGLWRIWFDVGATQQYYPLLHTAFWLEHRLWGDAVLGYHLLNFALHATAAWLIIAILRRLSIPGAWIAGLVFALHPIQAETVAWISEQKTTLSAVFYLSSALVYLRFNASRRRRDYALAAALFALALLSKTVTATLPAALLVLIWWQRGRLEWKRDVAPLLPWVGVGAAAGLFTAWLERTSIGAQGADFALSFGERCLLAGRILCFYMGKLLWPAGLTFAYPRWRVDAQEAWQYAFPAACIAAAALLLCLARRHRGPLAGYLFFAGTLFPVLGFLNVYPFLFSFVADHFVYLACLGIIVPVAAAAGRRVGRRAWPAALAVALALGALTFRQAGTYRDSETLYRASLAANPASWLAHNNLCAILLQRPDAAAGAVSECQAAVTLRPQFAEAHNNLGSAFARLPGGVPGAIAEFRAAARLKPQFAEAHFNLGNALSMTPDTVPEAIAEYRLALAIRPAYLEARLNLATVLLRAGRVTVSMEEARAALRDHPDSAAAHIHLGAALAGAPGRLPEAIAEFEAAVKADPQSAAAEYNLAVTLAKSGRVTEALPHFDAALRLRPDPQLQRMVDGLRSSRRSQM